MWLVGEGDLLLIGAADRDVVMSLDGITRTSLPRPIVDALSTLGVDEPNISFALLSLFAGGPREIQQYAGESAIQTDDRPRLEFSAPRAIYGRQRAGNEAVIRALGDGLPAVVRDRLANATDADWTSRGRMELQAERFIWPTKRFARRWRETRGTLWRSAVCRKPQPEPPDKMKRSSGCGNSRRATLRNAEVRVELSRILAATGAFEPALHVATEAVNLAPDDPRAGEQLVAVVA
jgi:hypothetical protein